MKRLWRLLGRKESRATALAYGPLSIGSVAAIGVGGYVSPVMAENLSGVTACVGAIGSALATLPARVYHVTAEGRTEAPNHPASSLARVGPNPRQTWCDWLEMTLADCLLNGNALSVIESDAAGRVTALIPVPWRQVQVQLLASGRLAYDVVSYGAPWGAASQPRRFLQDEVFHLKDRSDDGFVGRSRISRAPDVLTAAIGLQTFQAAIWQNAATPSGLVEVPPAITPDGKRRLEAHFTDRSAGSLNARRILFVDKDTKYTPMSVSPEDAEVLASRRFTIEELCRLFQVPPPIVQDYTHGTFTNAQQAALWFAQLTLTPWARKVEAEFTRSIFGASSPEYHLEIDLSGLMRGDYAARWQSYAVAVQNGILDPNEIREQEGYNPRPASVA